MNVDKQCLWLEIRCTLKDGLDKEINEDEEYFEELECFTKDGNQIIIDIYKTIVRDSNGGPRG